jgi:hypothetical protein
MDAVSRSVTAMRESRVNGGNLRIERLEVDIFKEKGHVKQAKLKFLRTKYQVNPSTL